MFQYTKSYDQSSTRTVERQERKRGAEGGLRRSRSEKRKERKRVRRRRSRLETICIQLIASQCNNNNLVRVSF